MIDLRSDTVTQPTESMRKAIYDATLGDDVSREDPTVNRLEEYAAELMGKEAALLVPSGTFANQLALLTLAPRGSEVYLADDCHIVAHEAGASAVISGTQLRCIDSENPWLTWHEIEGKIRKNKDIHYPAPGLIEVENALGSGVIYPLEELVKIYRGASQWGIPLHMDGARIFNAALASGIEPRVIARNCDTMMFCLSKGLAAPVGSLLLGEKATIEEARYNRKIMGGGMRQAGIIAAAGLVALNEELPRL
ncbi:MAG: GntG family PLP-dependent aldolase [Spirochaetaceae bacterium]|jgi:threonine aldolase|nr:GntG family PLP-dependent aldolase [Spirochaetaceae bacterium]